MATIKTLIFLLLLLLPAALWAASGETLFVNAGGVNLRAGPGADYPALHQVEFGEEFIELKRAGEWVRVFVPFGEGEEGWISAAYLSKTRPMPDLEAAADPVFEQFKYEVFSFNDQIKAINVTGYYLKVLNQGDGVVWVVVNNNWLRQTNLERASNLRYLMRLWLSVQEKKRPLTVQLLDARSTKIMKVSEN